MKINGYYERKKLNELIIECSEDSRDIWFG